MDNTNIILVSDVHLDPREPARMERFQHFLEQVLPETDSLIILGDLFEFWFGYKSVIFHYYFPVLDLLWQFSRKNKSIRYVVGNHDFHMGPFIQQFLGIEIIQDGLALEIGSRRFYLCHGDCINPRDYGYRLLHKITRHWITVGLFRLIPPDIGIALAFKLSDLSRSYTSERDVVPRQSINEFFEGKLQEGFDGLIYGHTHKPEFTRKEWNNRDVLLVNSGDWIQHSTYLSVIDGEISLEEFC